MSASRSERLQTVLLAGLALLPCGGCILQGRARDLTVEEARQLVIQSLAPGQRRLPGLEASSSQRSDIPDFYRFEVSWSPPDPGSAVVGFFAVNRATGDVWELVLCTKKTSAELRRLQDELRKRIGLSGEELRKMTDEAPCQP